MATDLGRYQEFLIDASGNAISGGTVEIRRQGATVISGSGTNGFTATVNSRGGILNTDIVQVRRAGAVVSSSGGSSTFTVGSVTETTMTLSGHAGTMTLADEDRITPTASLTTLYNDIKGAETKTNPLTSASDGEVTAWMAGGFYDRLVANGASTKWSEDVYVPANPLGWINVKEGPYYAKGDGVTDDGPAIQMACDSVKDTGNRGGCIYFPPGDYLVTTAVVTNTHNILFQGASASGLANVPRGASTIASSGAITLITMGDTATARHGGPTFRDLCFRDSTGDGVAAVHLKRMNNFLFDNCNFGDFTVGTAVKLEGGAGTASIEYGMFLHCRSRSCKYGIVTTGLVSGITLVGGELTGQHIASSIGVDIASSGDTFRIIGTAIQDFDTAQVRVGAASLTYISGRFEDTSNTGTHTGIQVLTGAAHTTITGCTFTGFGPAIDLQAGSTDNQVVFNQFNASGDTITNNSTNAIIQHNGANFARFTMQYRRVGSTYDEAGFILRAEPGGQQLMTLRTGLNTGMLVKDADVDGGLWLTADGANRAVVGGGLSGDIAAPGTALTANNTTSSHILFADGAIYFYGNTGLTSGVAFTPTLLGSFSLLKKPMSARSTVLALTDWNTTVGTEISVRGTERAGVFLFNPSNDITSVLTFPGGAYSAAPEVMWVFDSTNEDANQFSQSGTSSSFIVATTTTTMTITGTGMTDSGNYAFKWILLAE